MILRKKYAPFRGSGTVRVRRSPNIGIHMEI